MADPAVAPPPPLAWRAPLRAGLQVLLLALLALLVFWPRPVWGLSGDGARLFDLHCAGCHPQGGNVIRRGRTLGEAALRRQGIEGAAAIAGIARSGIGRMDGYAAVLGEGGAEQVGTWVWEQALAGWPRHAEPPKAPSMVPSMVPSMDKAADFAVPGD
jgi:cytochrome c6